MSAGNPIDVRFIARMHFVASAQALEELAETSVAISDELLHLLNRLKVDRNVPLWKSALEAFLTVWKKDKIDAILERLHGFRAELTLRVVITNKNSLDGLSVTFQQSSQLIITQHDDLSRIMSDLIRQKVHADQDAIQRHLELLAAIRASTGPSNTNSTTPWQDVESFDFSQAMQKHILRSLMFYKMEDREEEIVIAHKKTFDWIFCDPEHQKKRWSNFSHWLRNDSGLYWINAKAASGKSTLMKFIRNDARTQQALKAWAEPHQLLVSSFYFWNHGTPMQKTLEGLLRSILHDVLKSRPELYPMMITGSWRESVLRNTATLPPEPTLVQLQKAFQNLMSQLDPDFKLCMIIDGLDEYDCAEMEYPGLAELFKSVSTSKNMKLVVSSRPLLVFEEAFAQEHQLRLQDLTADDIKIYVDDKVERHPRMANLLMKSPASAGNLASAIISKASGVFLWVRLVVESFLEGLTDGDGIEELQKTLDDLPEALEDLFRHTFRKIPQRYRSEASRIFQIVRQFQNTAEHEGNLVSHDSVLTATMLSFAAEGTTALDAGTRDGPLNLAQSSERRASLERRLKSRCCGLIEIHDKWNRYSGEFDQSTTVQSGMTLLGAEVQFLHKTVTDFLNDRANWDTILTGSAEDFDPNMALLSSYITQLKHLEVPKSEGWWEGRDSILILIEVAATFAKQTTNTSVQVELLHEMDRTMSLYWTRNRPKELYHWCNCLRNDDRNKGEWYDSFLSFCIDRGLCHYVAAEFNEHGKVLIQKKGRPLLDHAVRPRLPYRMHLDPMIVTILLENGANPNKSFNGRSAWSTALYEFHQQGGNECFAKILELLVLHRANLNAVIETHATKRARFKKRYSALRVLRCSIDRADGETLPIIQRVIRLLIERGAKEQEWCDGVLVPTES
ncbi:hypothetical protein BDV97DRAFT_403131 [Delphinella strobiligena]|nr:hypothetical protein BDV97DRAFT_403131 [Delphinella strobiligena]